MKILNTAAYISLTISFIIVGVAMYWLFYPYKLFVYNTSPMKVINTTVKIGEDLRYIADYCKYTSKIPTSVKRQLVGGYAYDLPVSTSSNFPQGCGKIEVAIPMYLPISMRTGKYRIKVTGEYQANPLRTWGYEVYTEEFNLIK